MPCSEISIKDGAPSRMLFWRGIIDNIRIYNQIMPCSSTTTISHRIVIARKIIFRIRLSLAYYHNKLRANRFKSSQNIWINCNIHQEAHVGISRSSVRVTFGDKNNRSSERKQARHNVNMKSSTRAIWRKRNEIEFRTTQKLREETSFKDRLPFKYFIHSSVVLVKLKRFETEAI